MEEQPRLRVVEVATASRLALECLLVLWLLLLGGSEIGVVIAIQLLRCHRLVASDAHEPRSLALVALVHFMEERRHRRDHHFQSRTVVGC